MELLTSITTSMRRATISRPETRRPSRAARTKTPRTAKGTSKFSRPFWPPVQDSHPPKDKKLKRISSIKVKGGMKKRQPVTSVPPKERVVRAARIAKDLLPTRSTDLRTRKEMAGLGPWRKRKQPVSFPCGICGNPKRKEFGHSQYKGEHFCEAAGGGKLPNSGWMRKEDQSHECQGPQLGGTERNWRHWKTLKSKKKMIKQSARNCC
ncbi:hypothetical protein DPEC_G00134310 [Dallia pectoralis]|uniref:Uncharacterized protein n=1 Tax=Dallia pectoralis TaxID=75939 RepID=A0ACC2GRM5_DALPE|nr:hypothetical protein DPEC_G00134310 [Dallia pectoralis]